MRPQRLPLWLFGWCQRSSSLLLVIFLLGIFESHASAISYYMPILLLMIFKIPNNYWYHISKKRKKKIKRDLDVTTKIFQKLVAITPTMVKIQPRTLSPVASKLIDSIAFTTTGPFHNTKANAPPSEIPKPQILACPLMLLNLSFSWWKISANTNVMVGTMFSAMLSYVEEMYCRAIVNSIWHRVTLYIYVSTWKKKKKKH